MKARVECRLLNDEMNFIIEFNVSTVSEVMNKLKDGILPEFDHSFETDEWKSINISIER